MKKVLIIGSKGMAGHVIYNHFKENTDFTVVDIARGSDGHLPTHQIDVTNLASLTDVLKKEMPDYVINCIGILNRDAEDNPEKSILLNSYFPHFLAKNGKALNFRLIHISTDCVFDGKKGGYTEDSFKDGKGFYAETKALGEVTYANNLTIRTSIIGPELKENGIGLFHWFMNQQGKIKGYTNAYWTGITTVELAKVIVAAISEGITGLHHVVNNEKISKYNLVNLFKEIFDKTDIEVEPYDDYRVDKSLIKTNNSFSYTVPSYRQMLHEMKVWIDEKHALYNFY
ncbi:SDR family oxidoreductase [Pedobacter psychrodurus]|uniref:dTDP-4-dehydrorhamnose reductase family protein n=1 Tax=Pedobacter psychrodurus TaxID=2530456 RepID=UPI00292D7779|nr:SDR family oxidoreductase [Pedobacter psychrodurus]